MHAAYVVAELGGDRCDALKINLTERYAATGRGYDFTHTVVVPAPLSDSPAQVFFPAYVRRPRGTMEDAFAFTGVELSRSAADCLVGLKRLQDPSQIPMLLDVQLRPEWEEVTPYATIAGIEARANPPEVYAFPADLPRTVVKRSLAAQPVALSTRPTSPSSPRRFGCWIANGGWTASAGSAAGDRCSISSR